MHFGRVIGRLVSTVKVKPLKGYPLLWVEPVNARGEATGGAPFDWMDLAGEGPVFGDPARTAGPGEPAR